VNDKLNAFSARLKCSRGLKVVTVASKDYERSQKKTYFSKTRWFDVPAASLQYSAAKQQVHAAKRQDQNWGSRQHKTAYTRNGLNANLLSGACTLTLSLYFSRNWQLQPFWSICSL
jgi:hypothetical protein